MTTAVGPEQPADPEPVNPALVGPYSADNGVDAYGHPVNGFGRCEGLNADPATCPPA